MRGIIFYINLCVLLLCGGNPVLAETHVAGKYLVTQNTLDRQQVKVRSTIPATVLIESTDIDLDEEFHTSNEFKGTKTVVLHNDSVKNWYLTFSGQPIIKDYCQHIKIFTPFCGYSNPIYIRQQVLRI